MLTDYLVRCPHRGCGWFGTLLPRSSAEVFRGPALKPSEVLFQCPQCLGEWRARRVGDDVVTVEVLDAAAIPVA